MKNDNMCKNCTIAEKYEELKVTNCDLKAKADKYDKVVEDLEGLIDYLNSVQWEEGMSYKREYSSIINKPDLAKAIKSKLIGEGE